MATVRHGGCNCGAVRFEMHGAPNRVGICHCLTCRRDTGAPFMAFAVWDKSQAVVTGETWNWVDTTERRHYCPACGSRLFGTRDHDDEVEVRIGCMDAAPGDLQPSYESWTIRRETWLQSIAGAVQYERDRTADA